MHPGTMNENLEIRKLPASHVQEIAKNLDFDENWKVLAENIPNTLERNNFFCADENNRPKYNANHISIIEREAKSRGKSCTEILLDEWGTSGRIRPTLAHLWHILLKSREAKSELYPAQVCLARILNKPPPPKPSTGPAADISISSYFDSVEDIDAGLNLPALSRIKDAVTRGENGDENNTKSNIYANFVEAESDAGPNVPDLSAIKNATVTEVNENIMRCSSSLSISEGKSDAGLNVPDLSAIKDATVTDADNTNENFMIFNSSASVSEGESGSILPALSAIKGATVTRSDNALENYLICNCSASGSKGEYSDEPNIPNLSQINTPSVDNAENGDANKTEAEVEISHISYSDLQKFTNNFDKTNENTFLGSGSFGSVFLAAGLENEPAVVKAFDKCDKENIKKLFDSRIFGKSVHEHLVKYVGHSTDGTDFCLAMEYVSRGSLRSILKDSNSCRNLHWKDRIKIGLHTARGLLYLHTTFDTPLVHRNLKSSNILLDAENNAKLSDFGLTENTERVYLPPEASDSNYSESVKLDIFSFGVVLLELLSSLSACCGTPFENIVTAITMCQEEDMASHLDTSVGTWTDNHNNFAKELFEMVKLCLSDDPKKRRYIEYHHEQMSRVYGLINY